MSLRLGDHISAKTKEKCTVYDNLRLRLAAKVLLVDIPTSMLKSVVPCLQKGGKEAKKLFGQWMGSSQSYDRHNLASQQTLKIT